VDDPFLAVDRGYTSLAPFERATSNENFVVFAKRDGADLKSAQSQINPPKQHDLERRGQGRYAESLCSGMWYLVLLSEFLGERGAHDCSSVTARRGEVCLTLANSRQRHTFRDFLREEETSADCFAIAVLRLSKSEYPTQITFCDCCFALGRGSPGALFSLAGGSKFNLQTTMPAREVYASMILHFSLIDPRIAEYTDGVYLQRL
jgi:hypothetical protein